MEVLKRSVVKWFDAKKGYGFIVHPGGGSDIFVHYSQVISDKQFKTLRTGEVVEFELRDGPKGVHATSVKPIDTLAQREVPASDGQSTPFTGDGALDGARNGQADGYAHERYVDDEPRLSNRI